MSANHCHPRRVTAKEMSNLRSNDCPSTGARIGSKRLARALAMSKPTLRGRGHESHNADVHVKLEQWQLTVDHIADALHDLRGPGFNRTAFLEECNK